MNKILLVTFSDNADHQDTLFGLYELLNEKRPGEPVPEVFLLATRAPKVELHQSEHTWLVDCPLRPGITRGTFRMDRIVALARRINRENFDAVYFESLHVWNLALMQLCRKNRAGRRVVMIQCIHEVIPHTGDKEVKGVELMNKAVCQMADHIVLRSRIHVPIFCSRYPKEPARVHALELWRRYPAFTPPAHSGKLLFFGRLNPYKGIENLLEVVRMCPELNFEVMGRADPQTEDIIEELQRQKNVTMTLGYVSDEEMKDAFSDADYLILPYSSASQSGVIIDAYKYSRPVVAYDVGAIHEQVENGVSGWLVPAGENERFADALKNAMALDQRSYDNLCAGAYHFGCEKYAVDGGAARFLDFLQRCVPA